jgi:hypothetical protein
MKHGYLDTYPIPVIRGYRDTSIFQKQRYGDTFVYIYIKYKKILNVMIFHKIKKQQLKEF